jgi:hypothetical protein
VPGKPILRGGVLEFGIAAGGQYRSRGPKVSGLIGGS